MVISRADRAREGLHAHGAVRRSCDTRLRHVERKSGGDGAVLQVRHVRQEVVATYDSGGLVVLVTIERVRAEVEGLPEQDWSLRVTQVFRRDGTEWRLVHRHADPLANGISLEQAAALARGDQMR
jgi:ketosteroid isomerase-like protein